MNEQTEDFNELVKQYIQSIDEQADIILLFPQGKRPDEEIQIYVLTAEKVNFELEQNYYKACYNLELASKHNLSIYLYAREDWHNQLLNTPIYRQVSNEGIVL
ncbi:hypothetical protein [Carboxylicivirga sp. RSCT41]|uniref:hypothetical protein n=1 Tax=Carboxylicivirga agarovorans TaxID=3417570 RepID=UPI003D33CAA9